MSSIPAQSPKELTIRGLILGVFITLIFTAANVFFGLKAGLTFATSIPAAVISMAVLRGFRGMTIQENNIVQTVASAAGTLSSEPRAPTARSTGCFHFTLSGLPLLTNGVQERHKGTTSRKPAGHS